MLTIQGLSYSHSDKKLLFSEIHLTVHRHDKMALTGNNGIGKSTLLKIIAGELQPSAGQINVATPPYYIPQVSDQFNPLTVAQVLGIDNKLRALKEILNGNTGEDNFMSLNDDWTIEERCKEALSYWDLPHLDLFQKMETLSGGQKTKVFLTGIFIHQPDFILLDEPSNHLDLPGRQRLYDFIRSTESTLLVVSHDRKLLHLLDTVCELSKEGIKIYGGNYSFYTEQKKSEANTLSQDLQNKEKDLRKAKEKERKTLERRQRLDNRGKGKQEKAGVARIMRNTLRNSAENSTAKLKSIHTDKIVQLKQELQDIRSSVLDTSQMKLAFDHSRLHKGKTLFIAENMNFAYENGKQLWHENLSIRIFSGERIAIKGANGSGKTTLIKIISGDLKPQRGKVFISENRPVYLDQDYSLINNKLKIYEQVQQFNTFTLQEHDIKIRLSRFLFTQEDWGKPCSALSAGERMRLILCCLSIGHQSPDIIILDEPTNNLDLQNMAILTHAIADYQGTLIVISHDETFLAQVNTARVIEL